MYCSEQSHVHSTSEKHLNKVADLLQVLNKEAQSLLLTFNRFHIFVLGFLPLTLSKYLFAGQGILRLEQQWFLCYIFSSKQTHAQSQQQKP